VNRLHGLPWTRIAVSGVLVVGLLVAVLLTATGGGDDAPSAGGDAPPTSSEPSTPAEFCVDFAAMRTALNAFLDSSDPEDLATLKERAEETWSGAQGLDMPAEALSGLAYLTTVFTDAADDATAADLVATDDESSLADGRDAEALKAYVDGTCEGDAPPA